MMRKLLTGIVILTELSCVTGANVFTFFKTGTSCVEAGTDSADYTIDIPQKQTRLLQCLSTCGDHTSCIGVRKDVTDTCILLKDSDKVRFSATCSVDEEKIEFYEKERDCLNDGKMDTDSNSCKCKNGWVGTRCQTMARSCRDLLPAGYKQGIRLLVNLQLTRDSDPVKAMCYNFKSNYSRLYILYSNGAKNHNKTWEEYVSGYTESRSNHWFGLENIAIVVKTMTKVIVKVRIENTTHHWMSTQQYTDFTMADESQGYSFNISLHEESVSGNLKFPDLKLVDFLSPSVNVPFSTWDQDSDGDKDRNVAAENGAGWWFTNQTQFNILGQLPETPSENSMTGYLKLPGVDSVDNFLSLFSYVTITVEEPT